MELGMIGSSGAILIYGGNSNFEDSMDRAEASTAKGIHHAVRPR